MSFGVTGKWCDIDGVWIDPVMAQMMTLPLSDGDVGIDRPRALRLHSGSNTGEKGRVIAYKSAYGCRERTPFSRRKCGYIKDINSASHP